MISHASEEISATSQTVLVLFYVKHLKQGWYLHETGLLSYEWAAIQFAKAFQYQRKITNDSNEILKPTKNLLHTSLRSINICVCLILFKHFLNTICHSQHHLCFFFLKNMYWWIMHNKTTNTHQNCPLGWGIRCDRVCTSSAKNFNRCLIPRVIWIWMRQKN